MVAKATKVSSKFESASADAKVASKKSISASAAARGFVQSSATAASVQQDPAAKSIGTVSGSFLTPLPGVHGACDNVIRKGTLFVIMRTFPEAGGGDAGTEGKTIIKSMVQSFGGKVITKFSSNTSE